MPAEHQLGSINYFICKCMLTAGTGYLERDGLCLLHVRAASVQDTRCEHLEVLCGNGVVLCRDAARDPLGG
jgi:hypothetical protein